MKNNLSIKKMALSVLFLTIGWLLPFVTMQVPEIGSMLCPMHIPIFLCGLILGPWYGLLIGLITPTTRTLMFGTPILFPTSLCMIFELATYGYISGYFYKHLNRKNQNRKLLNLFITLIIAMIVGRFIYGMARFLSGLFSNNLIALTYLLIEAYLGSWPGILIQLTFIPIILTICEKIPFIINLSKNNDNNQIKVINNKINELLSQNKTIVIAIDGMAGSGKTTLADQLSKYFDARIIHLDDFFLPKNLRTKERYQEIGGNIHYEKVLKDIIPNLNSDIKYQPFNCQIMDYDQLVEIPHKMVTIVEGSYALHPKFGHYYDFSIYLKVSKKLQKRRIIARNGKEKYQVYHNKWIKLENRYFKTNHLVKKANFIVNEKGK